MLFDKITAAPGDPILGLGEAFKADPRSEKVNLGIGVYKDANGRSPVLPSVKAAESRILADEDSKNYLGIDGLAAYNLATQKLLFGADNPLIASGRLQTAQSLGGSGALRIAAEFVKRQTAAQNVWISAPSWPNHNAIFQAVGMNICDYRYYDKTTHGLDWDGMLEDLAQARAGDVVLLHGCCHNPTGIDPTPEQWRQLAQMSAEKGWLPLFDVAYQGFGNGLEEDAYGLRVFAENHAELLVASSYSKNFGLYSERVGAFTLLAADADTAQRVFTQIKAIIRTLYSNPAAHGSAIVAAILQDDALKAQWQGELDEMRERIKAMRRQMADLLKEYGAKQDFEFIVQQNGMFSFSGLSPEQVDRLKDEFAVYAVRSGRINVAGITADNIRYLCESIVKVL